MKIGIAGTGYVGLVAGICFAEFGTDVVCADIDIRKIQSLNSGIVPFYEPGVQEWMNRNRERKRICFTTDMQYMMESAEVIFLAVGTPEGPNWEADLTGVLDAAGNIGKYMNGYKVIVTKSTVPVGTGARIKSAIQRQLDARGANLDFDIASNPEFLREGRALEDFVNPDRIVIGTENKRAEEILKKVYQVWIDKGVKVITTGIATAETAKYACNAFLATKISFMNEVANLCETVGAEAGCISEIMGTDSRIGPRYLEAGPGYGGSCFPKDTKAFAAMGLKSGSRLTVVETAITANERQKHLTAEKIRNTPTPGNTKNRIVGILGLTFKADTDDMREAPSIAIIRDLASWGIEVKMYDPKGLNEARRLFQDLGPLVKYCENAYDAAKDTDTLVILTEWPEFKTLDLGKVRALMNRPCLLDFRNLLDRKDAVRAGFDYYARGAGTNPETAE